MVTLDEEFYTKWVSHAHDNELIEEFISIMAMYFSPFLPEFSLVDILGQMEEILLYEVMKRFILSFGSVASIEFFNRYFGLDSDTE